MGREGRFYVYVLIDPRDQEIFYVGKGCGRRHTAHFNEWKAGRVINAAKFSRIGEIVESGYKPVSKIVIDGLQERRAFAEERLLIQMIGFANLTNMAQGIDADHERRKMVAWANRMIPRVKNFRDWQAERPRTEFETGLYLKVVNLLHDAAAA